MYIKSSKTRDTTEIFIYATTLGNVTSTLFGGGYKYENISNFYHILIMSSVDHESGHP
jgi:hypothetical protein